MHHPESADEEWIYDWPGELTEDDEDSLVAAARIIDVTVFTNLAPLSEHRLHRCNILVRDIVQRISRGAQVSVVELVDSIAGTAKQQATYKRLVALLSLPFEDIRIVMPASTFGLLLNLEAAKIIIRASSPTVLPCRNWNFTTLGVSSHSAWSHFVIGHHDNAVAASTGITGVFNEDTFALVRARELLEAFQRMGIMTGFPTINSGAPTVLRPAGIAGTFSLAA